MPTSTLAGFKTGSQDTSGHLPPAHMPTLDGVRGVAIAVVLICHANNLIDYGSNGIQRKIWSLTETGWVGVDLFFVLSGFLITGILLSSKESPTYYRSFFARRALRVFPLYYLVLAILYFGNHRAIHGVNALSLAGYWFNYRIVYLKHTLSFVVPFWSLCVEEQFYLIWPFVIAFTSVRTLKLICWVGMLFALALRLSLLPHVWAYPFLYVATPCRMDGLLAGSLVAVWRRDPTAWITVRKYSTHALVLSIAGLSGIALWSGHFLQNVWGDTMYGFHHDAKAVLGPGLSLLAVLFGAIIVKALHQGTLYRLLLNRSLRALGKYSYGMYVIHFPIIELLKFHTHFGRGAKVLLLPPILFATTFGLAYVSYNLYEKRFLSLKRKFPALPTPQVSS